jgi:hypothetical protein
MERAFNYISVKDRWYVKRVVNKIKIRKRENKIRENRRWRYWWWWIRVLMKLLNIALIKFKM